MILISSLVPSGLSANQREETLASSLHSSCMAQILCVWLPKSPGGGRVTIHKFLHSDMLKIYYQLYLDILYNSVLTNYMQRRFGIGTISCSPTDIILNSMVPGKGNVINFLCLITKQFIYAQKCLGNKPSFPALEVKIRHIENLEKYIAKKNEKLNTHYRKWGQQKTHMVQPPPLYIQEYIFEMWKMVTNFIQCIPYTLCTPSLLSNFK